MLRVVTSLVKVAASSRSLASTGISSIGNRYLNDGMPKTFMAQFSTYSLSAASNEKSVITKKSNVGGIHSKEKEMAVNLCNMAAEGNLDGMKELILKGGVNVNIGDYDKRTALHLAAAEDNLDMVKFLFANGANIHAVDRWNGTPLQDAVRSDNPEVTAYLISLGAKSSLSEPLAAVSMCQAAALGNLKDIKEMVAVGYNINVADYDKRTPLHLAASEGKVEVVNYLISQGVTLDVMDRFGNTPLSDALRGQREEVARVLVAAGANLSSVQPVQDAKVPTLSQDLLIPTNHLSETFHILKTQGVFSHACLYQEVDWYYNKLNMSSEYFKRFNPKDAAYHINAYIASRHSADAEVNVRIVQNDQVFYMTPATHSCMAKVEEDIHKITEGWSNGPLANHGQGLFHFITGGVSAAYQTKPLAVYMVDVSPYPVDTFKEMTTETNLEKIGTKMFNESDASYKAHIDSIMGVAVARNSPVVKIEKASPTDGTIPITIAFHRDSTSTSMWRISEILKASGIATKRKLAYTFANGMNVYTLFATPKPEQELMDFARKISFLFTVQPGYLTPLYVDGVLTAEQYAYSTAAAKFVYYFGREENEDMKALTKALETDAVNSTRLKQLRSKMKRDAITEVAISTALRKHSDILYLLYDDFQNQFKPGVAKEEAIPIVNGFPLQPKSRMNETILNTINKVVDVELDRIILSGMLTFNAHILKTNFFKYPKASMAFRLDPNFMGEAGGAYKKIPFGILMLMANDFQGFHVRFQDVARGGIRIIKSANRAVYDRNAHSLFMENYNLANTQNDKNKDLPEFGSKGTILLHRDSQSHVKYAFRKYISGVLDLINPSDPQQIVDRYGHPEVLFMGPDENTADLMEWAALYAKQRKYAYWKSFTTGKPQTLGGVPHDIYGMTTRSVHKFVTETLSKLGLKEEEMTKVMTGGPDGDLGSNEILISKDKILAIVDGSGVLYDPKGLDRTELTRLAHARVPIDTFDSSKLSPQGFKVLVEDKDKKLPDGEVVENGMIFRNEFHLRQSLVADLFVPCGGRPEAVNSSNVHKMLQVDGKTPRFKIVVEGANLFFSQEARLAHERAGVIHFKDASTNKGGVTSSSLEVLSGLAMTEEEHAKHMCIQKDGQLPEFYKKYVIEIQNRVEENAALEFNALWQIKLETKVENSITTELLSDKINNLNINIAASKLWEDVSMRHRILNKAIPKSLIDLLGLDTIINRVPVSYTKAIFASYLAGRYVYKYGLTPNEFSFYQFMKDESEK